MENQRGMWFRFIVIGVFSFAMTFMCLGAQNVTVGCSQQERLALLKFKHSVLDEFGMLSSWVGNDCCNWKRVHCDDATGRVVSLYLRGDVREITYYHADSISIYTGSYFIGEDNYLVGRKVDSSLANLRHLKYLDLSGNDFRGSQIPEFIGSLNQLSYLNLSDAGFSGIIPPNIGNLSKLEVLDLSDFSYSSQLTADNMAWVSGLSSVKRLDLSGVDFRGAQSLHMVFYMIPSLIELSLSGCKLSNLNLGFYLNLSRTLPTIKYLDLSLNRIEGSVPFILTNMSSLLALDVSGNKLNSSIPVMANLIKLDLSFNNFREIEPIGIWRQCHLKELIVSNNFIREHMVGPSTNVSKCSRYALEILNLFGNFLYGSIPRSLGKFTYLTGLDLAYNRLTGPIPEALGRLRLLEVLDLSLNQLSGPIPTFLGKLSSLQAFSASSNLLNGTIPVSMGQLTKLELLDISNNSFEGIVSEAHFSNLSMLWYLDTTFNTKLTFNVSREWLPPFQLRTARLGFCNIGHEFPQWFQNQRKLGHLVLSNGGISGPLPTWMRNMPIIHVLDLSHNKLSGPLTNLPLRDPFTGFGDEYSKSLNLQNNDFSGLIPKSLCRRTDLEVLDLSSNRLTGKIPNCLENLRNLRTLILSSNELSGVIPSSLGYISPTLTWLSLNDNNFMGGLPRDLSNLQTLRVLDLGENELSGSIPGWIGEKLPYLVVFRLHQNNFTGRLPTSLCKKSYLQILDVAHNLLTGPIPRCFSELYSMVEANRQHINNRTSGNEEKVTQHMNGVDLEFTTILEFVVNMDLSSNKLVGEIPQELMLLSQLVGLNLSHNHLTGPIPDEIGNLKTLLSLDLSDNKLSGMIPPSMAALNFLSHLNLSNNDLSGRIPTGNQLQTLSDQPSIYAGNSDLCGAPLPKNCSNHEDPTRKNINDDDDDDDDDDEPKKVWFYLTIVCGYATGFWGVIGVLLLKKQWRQKLYMFVEVTMDKIYVAVVVRTAKIKRGRESVRITP